MKHFTPPLTSSTQDRGGGYVSPLAILTEEASFSQPDAASFPIRVSGKEVRRMRSQRRMSRSSLAAHWERLRRANLRVYVALTAPVGQPAYALAFAALPRDAGANRRGEQETGAPRPTRNDGMAASILMLGQDDAGADGRGSGDDAAAFFTLLAETTPTLLRLAAALVGPDDAEDAVQEAVMRAWRAWPGLRDPAAASPWLLRIVGNVCRDWRRGPFGMRQRLHAPLDSVVDERGVCAVYGGQAPGMAANADPGSSAHAEALDVRRVVNTLDDDLRLVVVLRYFIGMDATAIGAALNTPPATIRTRLRRALGVLRKRLDAPPSATPHDHDPQPGDQS